MYFKIVSSLQKRYIFFYDMIPYSSPKYSCVYFPKYGHCSISIIQPSQSGNRHWYNRANPQTHSNFIKCPNSISLFFLVQDPIEEHVLYLIIIPPLSSSIWNRSFSLSPCFMPLTFIKSSLLFSRMNFNLGLFDVPHNQI